MIATITVGSPALLLPEPADPINEYGDEPNIQPNRSAKNRIGPKRRREGNDHERGQGGLHGATLPKYSCDLRRDQIFLLNGDNVRKSCEDGKNPRKVDREQAGRVSAA